jgi:hypothetical protein
MTATREEAQAHAQRAIRLAFRAKEKKNQAAKDFNQAHAEHDNARRAAQQAIHELEQHAKPSPRSSPD